MTFHWEVKNVPKISFANRLCPACGMHTLVDVPGDRESCWSCSYEGPKPKGMIGSSTSASESSSDRTPASGEV